MINCAVYGVQSCTEADKQTGSQIIKISPTDASTKPMQEIISSMSDMKMWRRREI